MKLENDWFRNSTCSIVRVVQHSLYRDKFNGAGNEVLVRILQ